MKAIWNDQIIAESDDTVVVEGNHYFPFDSVNMDFLSENEFHTVCPWKGEADYFDVKVGSHVNENAAWIYRATSDEARNIKNHIAFWQGVEVVE